MKDISSLFLVTKFLSKNRSVFAHGRRAARIANAIAEKMGYCYDGLEQIRLAATVHDIGKVLLPQEILCKPGKLDADEKILGRKHPEIGYRLLNDLVKDSIVAEVALQHHEYMDGSGYPSGLKGKEINPVTRIITVADAIDTMITPQVYRSAMRFEQVMREIRENSGRLYDPAVVDISFGIIERLAAVCENAA